MSEKEIRLIDANACPCNECRRQWCELPHLCTNFGLWLRRTIDPESLRPKGKWGISKTDWFGSHIIQCSVCGEEWCFEELGDVVAMNYHYCPNCGAKMEE